MWLSCCFLFLSLIFTIVTLGVDFLLSAHGQSYRIGDEIAANVAFGYNEIRMTVFYQWDSNVIANRTVVVNYSQAYEDLCVNKNLRNQNIDSSYCNDLQSLESAGQIYFGLILSTVAILTVAVFVALVIAVARCGCKKPMTVGAYLVSGFGSISVVLAIVASFISWNGFISNAVAVLSVIYAYYYPVAQVDTQWDNAKVGPSLICLYVATGFGFLAVLTILLLEKRGGLGCRDRTSRVPYHRGENPALLEAEGQESNSQNSTIQYPKGEMTTSGAFYPV